MRILRALFVFVAFVFALGWIGPSARGEVQLAEAGDGVTINGTVTDAAGRPVAGATVALVSDASVVMTLTDGSLRKGDEDDSAFTAGTDDTGRFVLGGIDRRMLNAEACAVVATHPEAGYAEVTIDGAAPRPGASVRLAPWARLEATVNHGGRPAAGTKLRLVQSPFTGPQLWAEDEVVVGDDGRVVLGRCRPGLVVIDRALGDGKWQRADVAVLRRGETTRWKGDLQRRRVRGRLVLPVGVSRAIRIDAGLYRIPDRPEPRLPDAAREVFGPERKQWMARWVETTDEGRLYELERVCHENQRMMVTRLEVAPDGTVTAEDVPMGTYNLWVNAGLVSADDAGANATDAGAAAEAPKFRGTPFYRTSATVEPDANTTSVDAGGAALVRIEPAAGAAGDEPVPLPDVLLSTTPPHLEVGAPMPDLALRRLVEPAADGADAPPGGGAGKPIRVSDYRGKYVLLDCWATWCGPCLAATPALKELHEAHTAAGRLVIVGVSFDEEPAHAMKYVRKASLPWAQAIVGPAGDTVDGINLRELFGHGLPNFILIDPDGRLASKGHELRDVREILDEAAKTAETKRKAS
jgi:thiol-disulfide isomerase/thioredoxin